MKTAVLIDGGYFIKRFNRLYPQPEDQTPKRVVELMNQTIRRTLRKLNGIEESDRRQVEIYRIFFYDCPPLTKNAHNPVTGRHFSFGDTETAKFRFQLHTELKRTRKVALRLGRLDEHNAQWAIRPKKVKELLQRKISLDDLQEHDVTYDSRQKGVDMKIGLDIASLAYKKAVKQIVLIAGDSDFVPAAKLARREGIDFVLDPMKNHVNPELHEHIDGLISLWPTPPQRS